MLGRYYSAAEDTAIFALRAIGCSGTKIAAVLGRSPISLESHLRRLKLSGSTQPFKKGPPQYAKVTADDDPIEGETWIDVPDRGLAVSSHQRVRSLRTGHLRQLYTQKINGALAVNFETVERRGTMSLKNLIWEAAGKPPRPRTDRPRKPARPKASRAERPPTANSWYRPFEDDHLRQAKSLRAACAALPYRTYQSVKRRAWTLGIRYGRWEPAAPGTGPQGKADYEAAKAAVPKWLRPENREDLINDIVMMQLEGFDGTAAEAFKIARARHQRLFNEFRDLSIDAVIPGTDRLKFSDLIASDRPHF